MGARGWLGNWANFQLCSETAIVLEDLQPVEKVLTNPHETNAVFCR